MAVKTYYYIKRFKGIELKKSIKVNLQIETDGDWILSIGNLNLFAYGENLSKVKKEIKQDLYHLYNSLFIDNLRVAGSAKIIKENFKEYLNGS